MNHATGTPPAQRDPVLARQRDPSRLFGGAAGNTRHYFPLELPIPPGAGDSSRRRSRSGATTWPATAGSRTHLVEAR